MLAKRISEGMRAALERLGTKTAVAEASGVNRGALTAYYNGRKNVESMTVSTFERLLPVLTNINVTYQGNREGVPGELEPLLDAWDDLPVESRQHVLYIIDAVLRRHGLRTYGDEPRTKAAHEAQEARRRAELVQLSSPGSSEAFPLGRPR